ncbi:acylphosphatase [Paragonimus westermani]|uniref:acylphosphatase n=1 Tax=Paragonimus westermani TaxID=34504 RepID=A0A5J4NFJ2_9TREM|nr:acylphosphatase [Paragonimus westermani]
MSMLRACEFEVFGRVQGEELNLLFLILSSFQEYFLERDLQYASNYAKELGVVGWVKNTDRGTVCGAVEGREEAVDLFKKWLSSTGSPKSRIDRCQFKSEKPIANTTFTDFSIRR